LLVTLALCSFSVPVSNAQTFFNQNARSLVLLGGSTDVTHTLVLQAPSLSNGYSLTLPGANAVGLLLNDGTGSLSWINILTGAHGGTGSQYVTFTGPTSAHTYTLPDADATLLSSGTGVQLQSTTPGTQQTGNINISGTLLAGKIGIGQTSPNATLDLNGTFAIRHDTATINGSSTNNNVSAGSTSELHIGLTGTAGASTITGFSGGTEGRRLRIRNLTGQRLTLANQNSGSSAGNQIFTGTGVDATIPTGSTAELEWDDATNGWDLEFAGGTMDVTSGGTGSTSFTQNGILYGNGSSPIQATSSAANSVLVTNGSSIPSLSQTLPSAVQGNITSLTGLTGAIQYPTALTFDGTASRTMTLNRNTGNSTSGQGLTVQAGAPLSGASTNNLAGGDLTLSSGISEGTGSSNIIFQTPSGQGSSSNTDNTPATRLTINATQMNLASGMELDQNGTQRLSSSGAGTLASLSLGSPLTLTNGGTGASLTASNGGIFYSTGSAGAILSGTATAGQILRSGASAAPTWSTATYPATAGTAGNYLRSDGTNFTSSAIQASDLPGSLSGFANPTASVGLTAVNGTATTAMRSDAAPALDQTISPTWTGTHTHQKNAIGTTSTDAVALTNTTAAAAGAQQFSPRLRLTGQGWKTNATAASQTVDWMMQTVPVQGAANPTSYLDFEKQINGAGYSNSFSLFSSGGAALGSTTDPGAGVLNVSTGLQVAGAATSGNYLRGNGTNFVSSAIQSSDLPGSLSGFANPTASVGLTAVNGTATTAMRSDAAPALDQTISPTWTGTHTLQKNAIGTTSTDAIALTNTTAAAAGAQQFSPRLRLTGQGWKTNATAASQTVDWMIQTVPVQGTANPTSYLDFEDQINGAGYANNFSLFSSGGAALGSTTDPGAGVLNVSTGLQVAGAATSGNYLRGNGTNFVSSAIQQSDISSIGVQYGPSATQTSLATGATKLFDVSYTAGSNATFAGGAITADGSGSSATNVTSTGLTIVAKGKGSGTVQGINVTATGGTTNDAIVATGDIESTAPGITTTITEGFVLNNSTAATAGTAVQQSPSLHFKSNVWNTTTPANNTFEGWETFIPTSGATPSGRFSWSTTNNGGTTTERMSLTDGATLKIGTASTTTGSISLANSANANLATITPASQAAARTYTIPDAGGAANFILSTSSAGQTIAGGATINGGLTLGTQLSVANGGTGGTSAVTGRNGLGIYTGSGSWSGSATTTVTDAHAATTSIIMVTITGSYTGSGSTDRSIKVVSKASGSFVVGTVGGGSPGSTLNFDYVIIN